MHPYFTSYFLYTYSYYYGSSINLKEPYANEPSYEVGLVILYGIGKAITWNKELSLISGRVNSNICFSLGFKLKYFTFEPHISFPDSKYGYKKENIYYFNENGLMEL